MAHNLFYRVRLRLIPSAIANSTKFVNIQFVVEMFSVFHSTVVMIQRSANGQAMAPPVRI